MSLSFSRCALGAALLFAVVGYAQQTQTVTQGVYTLPQADRGQAVYKDQCASCHGDILGGRLGPPLTGDDFLAAWNKEPLSELFSKIKNTMPQNAPGKLSAQQSVDLVAYILRAAKFPTGNSELRADEASLKLITLPSSGSAIPPTGNLAQVMRGILFPSSNIIFTVQTHDPAEKVKAADVTQQEGGFNFVTWGGGIYSGWEVVDYAAIALAESAPLMLTPGRRCENGKPVPVNDPEWIKFTQELLEAGKAAYKASQTRNQEMVSDVSNQVADSCSNCHQVYRDKRVAGRDAIDPSNKALRCTK